MSAKVFISTGSNIGDKFRYLELAKQKISNLRLTSLIKCSTVMVTAPVGVDNQDEYLNQVLLIETALSPLDLLKEFKDIEKALGRKHRIRWAEREIDIDIVCYGDVVMKTEEITIPHEQMLNRLFILRACVELMPDHVVPSYGKTFLQLYESLDDSVKQQKVRAFTS